LRNRVAKKVEAGSTNREIDDWLLESYGESILGRPRGALPYVVPAAALIAGAIAVTVFSLRSRRKHKRGAAVVVPELSEEDRDRIQLEIRTFAEGTE
jgi:cytochrome c-type biogenesis protein CcmH/NrfF